MPKSRLLGGSAETSRRFCSMRPVVWMSSPAIARSKVVLPQPDGPRKQMNSPSAISSEMSSRAVKPPNFLVRRVIRRYGAVTRLLLLRLRLRPVSPLPLSEDLRAVQSRPLEVVLDHVREHVARQVLDGLRHLGDRDDRIALVVELHRLVGDRPVDEG